MFNLNVYREVKSWKKPVHASRTFAAKSYVKLLPNIEVIGITGSVGKTLTQNAVYSILSQKFKTVVGDENLDPTFRIPKTILSAKPWHQKIILEYGVEHPGDMDHYLSIVKPKIAVVTSIATTHTKYFGNVEGVYKEKVKLVKALPKNGYAILNAGDPLVAQMASQTKAAVWWYGLLPRGPLARRVKNIVKISHFSQSLKGSKFRLHYNGDHASVSWKVIGQHQLTSAYAATTIGIIEGLTLKQIAKGLSFVKVPNHRLNPIVSKSTKILDDTYNASPEAAMESLKTFMALGKGLQKIAVFGEMKDLGNLSEKSHEKLGSQVAKSRINYLITVGKVAAIIGKSAKKNGFKGKIISVSSAGEATKEIKKLKTPKSLILIKGSRHAHLERIVYALLGKSTEITCYHCGKLK